MRQNTKISQAREARKPVRVSSTLKDIQQFKATGEFGAAINRVASILCRQGKWDYVEAWVPSEDIMRSQEEGNTLTCVDFYPNDGSAEMEAFQQSSQDGVHVISGPEGESNVGKAFTSRQASWQELPPRSPPLPLTHC